MMKIKFDLRSDWRVAADLPEGIWPTALLLSKVKGDSWMEHESTPLLIKV